MTDRLSQIKARKPFSHWVMGPIEGTEDWEIVAFAGSGERLYRVAVVDAMEDAEAIAHAPADIDWLIAEVERLRGEMATAQAELDEYALKSISAKCSPELLADLRKIALGAAIPVGIAISVNTVLDALECTTIELAEATARAEQAEAERDVLAMKLVMELPICPASFGFCPHDFRHCELPDQSPESEQQCWLSWASQEAAKHTTQAKGETE